MLWFYCRATVAAQVGTGQSWAVLLARALAPSSLCRTSLVPLGRCQSTPAWCAPVSPRTPLRGPSPAVPGAEFPPSWWP